MRAVLYVVMAVLFFVDPIAGMTSASIVFAILILVDGIVSLAIYFCSYGVSGFFGTTLLGSIFKIIAGILFLSFPGFSTVTISIMMAIYVIVISCNTIEDSLRIRKVSKKWVLPFILSIISLIGGIVMLFLVPANLVSVCGYIAGVVFAIDAIVSILVIIDMYRAKKVVKDAKKEVEEAITPNDDDIIDA